jgi:excisionase family DNA binding protein
MDYNIENLISVPEAAKRAGVARNTMRLAAKNGRIKAMRLGRNWLVDASDINRWKEEEYRKDMALRYPPQEDDKT